MLLSSYHVSGTLLGVQDTKRITAQSRASRSSRAVAEMHTVTRDDGPPSAREVPGSAGLSPLDERPSAFLSWCFGGSYSRVHGFWSNAPLRFCRVTSGHNAWPPILGFPTCKMRKVIALYLHIVSRVTCDNVYNDIIMSYLH